ncbi:hypothetical protein JM658_15195 [Joostella atrarenae]|uniref:Uncharacterized protein n=1 Tax=Joostella atrarenae TaxID=679257 RepID=A0ABS9J701_9FLAO|nr:hypothetical protein [Joostella atrarenae]MCF8716175.1 hypothetical protein [Joostella atrarenae]
MNKLKDFLAKNTGNIIIILLMLSGFINYDDFSTFEEVNKGSIKSKTFKVIMYNLNRTTIGYILGRGFFLMIIIIAFYKMFKKK